MEDDVQGELPLHRDFSTNAAEYLLKVCNPLKDQVVLKNILTGDITVTNVNVDKLLCCIKEGNFACAKLKSLSIHSVISKIKYVSLKFEF